MAIEAPASFDVVTCMEMLEHVPDPAAVVHACATLLKPGGHACVQSIVIDDALFERYIGSTDFIQQYIFPGGCLPCPSEFRRQAQAAGLEVVEELAFGHDYAETLKRWREVFMSHRAEVLKNGFDTRFLHIWEFYLAYCEAAFMEDNIDVVQYTLRKPGAV
jgi:cyclopropane-fatty-acyl-phospholipid synthase